MTLSRSQLHALADLATKAAQEAGDYIATRRSSQVHVQHKAVGNSLASQVVTEVDHRSQAILLQQLAPSLRAFNLALLTEETPDDGGRLEKPAFWCLDPMDGTLAFIQDSLGFSVSIGLVARDGEPLLGVVFDPVEGDLYRAVREGVFKNSHRMTLPALRRDQPLVLRTDLSFRTHPWVEQTQRQLHSLAEELGLPGAEIEYRVGAVMNACKILGEANVCYFKYPRTSESGGSLWDYAATACLFRELGAVACDIRGNALDLNRAGSTFMNHAGILYTSYPPLADKIIGLYQHLMITAGAE